MIYFKTHKNNTPLATRGFTLIELMVSIALFSVVITIVSAAYLNLLSLDRQAHATNDISTNLSFVMDTMARSLRTGTNYSCPTGTTGTNCSAGTSITFLDDSGSSYDSYILDTTNHQIGECIGLSTASTACTTSTTGYQTLTNPNITVNYLTFYVSGVGNSDALEPYVTFVIQGQINVDSNHPPIQFDIETSADDRQIDI